MYQIKVYVISLQSPKCSLAGPFDITVFFVPYFGRDKNFLAILEVAFLY